MLLKKYLLNKKKKPRTSSDLSENDHNFSFNVAENKLEDTSQQSCEKHILCNEKPIMQEKSIEIDLNPIDDLMTQSSSASNDCKGNYTTQNVVVNSDETLVSSQSNGHMITDTHDSTDIHSNINDHINIHRKDTQDVCAQSHTVGMTWTSDQTHPTCEPTNTSNGPSQDLDKLAATIAASLRTLERGVLRTLSNHTLAIDGGKTTESEGPTLSEGAESESKKAQQVKGEEGEGGDFVNGNKDKDRDKDSVLVDYNEERSEGEDGYYKGRPSDMIADRYRVLSVVGK